MTDLVERVLSGDTRAAARLCRLLDDRAPSHRELLRELEAKGHRGRLVGVTGSPGAGKSTLVDRLVSVFRTRGKVGVVAVDPSSPWSGGAVLGDRIRMQRHFEDPGVFIRSVATRGALGGLSRSARDVARVLEAWGADTVLVETVGVGQDELDVTRIADTTIVVAAPGLGDDVQAIKAGILEAADVFVVNKADRPGADAAVRDLENTLALGALAKAALASPGRHSAAHVSHDGGAGESGWNPPVEKTIATTGEGIDRVVARLDAHRAFLETPLGREVRRERTRAVLAAWLRDALAEALSVRFPWAIADAGERVLSGEDPGGVVDELVRRCLGPEPPAKEP